MFIFSIQFFYILKISYATPLPLLLFPLLQFSNHHLQETTPPSPFSLPPRNITSVSSFLISKQKNTLFFSLSLKQCLFLYSFVSTKIISFRLHFFFFLSLIFYPSPLSFSLPPHPAPSLHTSSFHLSLFSSPLPPLSPPPPYQNSNYNLFLNQ